MIVVLLKIGFVLLPLSASLI